MPTASQAQQPYRETGLTHVAPTADPMSIDTNRLEAYIGTVQHLPPAPTLMVDLMNLFSESDRDVDRVVEIISHCPSLTAEILRRCNSAFFGQDEPVTDMFQAISRVGFYEAYRIVVALFGARAMAIPAAGNGVDLEQLWQHSVLTAIAASELGKTTPQGEGLWFTIGLLHDLGKLILAAVEQDRYALLLVQTTLDHQSLVDAEQNTFGLDHAILGAHLLQKWNLPDTVVQPIRFHHRLSDAGNWQRDAGILELADTVAHHVAAHPEPNEADLDPPNSQPSSALLGFPPADVTKLIVNTRSSFNEIKQRMTL